jgi:hypothetical protein
MSESASPTQLVGSGTRSERLSSAVPPAEGLCGYTLQPVIICDSWLLLMAQPALSLLRLPRIQKGRYRFRTAT